MIKKTVLIPFFYFLIMSTTLAQEAKIDIEHIGYGETPRQAYFSIHNVGKVPIKNIIIYVDGSEYQRLIGQSSPGKGFETVINLEPGEHLIEVRTAEGAYDSLNITISPVEERFKVTTTIKEGTKDVIQENKLWFILGILLVMILILWILMRKPRLAE